MKRNSSRGQSLIEVVMALTVILLVILALVKAVVAAIKANDLSKQETLAANLAQEGIEVTRALRDSGWNNFYLQGGTGIENQYQLITSTLTSGPCPSTPNIPSTIFTRCVYLLQVGSDKVKARVVVKWQDSSGNHQSEVISNLTKWQGNR